MDTRPEATRLHPIVQIYLGRALDPLIQTARGVARDAEERPEVYGQLPDELVQLLSDIRTYTGIHPGWPDTEQRIQTARRTLGRFYRSFPSIRREAISLAESASTRNERLARRALNEEAQAFRAAVRPMEGEELDAPAAIETSMLQRAETVLTSTAISSVFGIPEVPAGTFPDGGVYSAEIGLPVRARLQDAPG